MTTGTNPPSDEAGRPPYDFDKLHDRPWAALPLRHIGAPAAGRTAPAPEDSRIRRLLQRLGARPRP
jgi:hypothetical protein